MIKKSVSFFLCILMLFSVANVGIVKADAASYDVAKLVRLAKKFPNGKYWNHVGSKKNNPDGYTSTPCNHHGKCKIAEGGCECNFFNNAIQCAGYAYKTASEIVGTNLSTWVKTDKLEASKLCVGDVIRYYNNTHSVTVVGVKGSTIAYTGANWGGNCLIKWSTQPVEKFTGLTYVLHDPKNNKKNTNLTFFENLNQNEEFKPEPGTEFWKVSADANLNVRNLPTTTKSTVLTSIPKGSSFVVTEKKDGDKYFWGKVEYGNIKGWAALNYATYISGDYQKPKVSSVSDAVAKNVFTLNWTAVNAADKYTVKIYSQSSEFIGSIVSKKTSAIFALEDAGKYKVTVVAENSKVPSWKIKSQSSQITVVEENAPDIEKIILKDKVSLTVKETYTLNAEFLPKNADGKLVWSSSDETVAKVDSFGKVTALKSGSAVITCKTFNDENISDSCSINVTPAKVSSLKQSASKSNSSSVSFSWKGVAGADGYRVYRLKSNGKWKLLASVAATSFTETKLSGGKEYKYCVKAYQKNGDKIITGEKSADFFATTAPKKVEGLKVSKIGSSSYTLSWKKSAGADKYVIYRYNDSKKRFEKYKTTKSASLTVSSKSGIFKKYRVAPVASCSGTDVEGLPSKSVLGFTKPKAVKAKITAKSKAAVISWKSVSGATGYEIFMKSGKTYKKIATLKSSKNSFKKTGLKKSVKYVFKIRAVTKRAGLQAFGAYTTLSVKAK